MVRYVMHIESVPNRNSRPAILLRESYREGGKVRKRTFANLSRWAAAACRGPAHAVARRRRRGTLTGGAAQGGRPGTEDDLPLHSFPSLLRDLATLVLNKATVPTNPNYTFNLLTKATPLQARVFELLAVNPAL